MERSAGELHRILADAGEIDWDVSGPDLYIRDVSEVRAHLPPFGLEVDGKNVISFRADGAGWLKIAGAADETVAAATRNPPGAVDYLRGVMAWARAVPAEDIEKVERRAGGFPSADIEVAVSRANPRKCDLWVALRSLDDWVDHAGPRTMSEMSRKSGIDLRRPEVVFGATFSRHSRPSDDADFSL